MLMYFVLPLWLAAGFADYLCHRATHIEKTSGWRESVLHLAQFAEMAVPVLAALFLEITSGVILMMMAFLVSTKPPPSGMPAMPRPGARFHRPNSMFTAFSRCCR
jgi:hypothetical protein